MVVVVVVVVVVPLLLHVDWWRQAQNWATIVCAGFVVVLLLLAAPARVTGSCVKVLKGVNALRTTYRGMVSYELAHKVNTLETYIKGLNKNQGPGFVIFGKVVSVAFLQVRRNLKRA